MARLPLVLGGVALLAAGAVALGLSRDGAMPKAPGTGSVAAAGEDAALSRLAQRVDQLSVRLDEESARREALEETLAGLASDLAVTSAGEPPPGAEASERAEEAPERPAALARVAGFDPESLVEAGFARRDAEAFAEILDDVELQRLNLRDRATREGWVDSGRFAREDRALMNQVGATRESFGEDFYDWALFSSGRPNRLRVGDVIDGSAASEAGLEPGDVVQHYAEARILDVDELRELTSGGVSGEATAVDVLRGDQTLRLYVPRGPLGVRLEAIRQKPVSAR